MLESMNELNPDNKIDDDDKDKKTAENICEIVCISNVVNSHVEEAECKFKKNATYHRLDYDYIITNKNGTYRKTNAKKIYKEKCFGDNASIKDPYSDNDLVKKQMDAKREYGKDWQNHAAEVDHINPLEQIHKKYKNAKYISQEELASIGNSDENLVVTNRKINNAKRSRTNEKLVNSEEYLNNKEIEIKEPYKQKMIDDGIKAEKYIKNSVRKKNAENFIKTGNSAGVEAAQMGAVFGGGMSLVRNLVEYVKGNKNADDVFKDTVKDTAESTIIGYGTGFLGTTMQYSMRCSSNILISTLSKTNLPTQIVGITFEVVKSFKSYFCGEIDGGQCLTELGEKGTGMISAALSSIICQLAIPCSVISGMIGGMIGYAFSNSYYNGLVKLLHDRKNAREERIMIEAECREALVSIRQYRSEVERLANAYFSEYTECFRSALDSIGTSLLAGDIGGVISGANIITEKLGGQVQYRNLSEFDTFMNDDSVDFVL